MSQLKPYHSQTFYILWNILILVSHLRPFPQRDLFPSCFPNKIVYIFNSTHACYIHIPSITLIPLCCVLTVVNLLLFIALLHAIRSQAVRWPCVALTGTVCLSVCLSVCLCQHNDSDTTAGHVILMISNCYCEF